MHVQSVRSDRARAVINYIAESPDHPYARIVAVTIDGDYDVVDLVVEPELPQHRAVAIVPEEPIRLRFPIDDQRPPNVHSRREGFPFDQVHTNYAPDSDGLCLCIWEENWNELRRALSAQALVERIRTWFTRMATGALHQEGQSLEPLLPASAHRLIIPPGPPAEDWTISGAQQQEGRWTIAVEPRSADSKDVEGLSFSVLTIQFAPRVHGALHARPRYLEELCSLAQVLGTDLIAAMRGWLLGVDRRQAADTRSLLLILTIPKQRETGEAIETWEVLAFMPNARLSQLGEALGCTLFDPRTRVTVARVPAGQPADLASIGLDHWSVIRRLDRATARVYAGSTAEHDCQLVAIGAGAIGSNVVVGTVRAGIGIWTIIDNDIVLPHNTVRQFQRNNAVGVPKAVALKVDAETVLAENGTAHFIWADVLNPGETAEQIRDSMKCADLVVDFSASPAVVGFLGDQSEIRRAASFFFNPDGSDLVILAEDGARSLRLDEIEAQYFLAVGADGRLAGHLRGARLDFIRYANACQDLTRPLPPWQVQTLSGLGSGQLVALIEESNALAKVWRLDVQTGAIVPAEVSVAAVERRVVDDWRFTVSAAALQSMRRLRAEAAPNESGGILIGTFDLSRRVAHVVAGLPAPPDSVQKPTYFVRGSKHLKPIVDALATASAGVLVYLGEWHSHPDNARPRPSADDEKVYAHLARHIGPTGAPYLMAICGKDETWFRLGREDRVRGETAIRDGGD